MKQGGFRHRLWLWQINHRWTEWYRAFNAVSFCTNMWLGERVPLWVYLVLEWCDDCVMRVVYWTCRWRGHDVGVDQTRLLHHCGSVAYTRDYVVLYCYHDALCQRCLNSIALLKFVGGCSQARKERSAA